MTRVNCTASAFCTGASLAFPASDCGTMRAARLARQLWVSPALPSCSPRILSAAPGTRGLAAAKAKAPASAAVPDKSDDLAAKKAKALELAMKDINSKCGAGTIIGLGDQPPTSLQTISTGSLTLDLALGGGYPQGRIIEIFGMESSGKSTLALHAIAEAQKQGGISVLIDAECAFDPHYAEKVGVIIPALKVVQPSSGEDAFIALEKLINSYAVDVVCVDSVAALVPRAEIEGDVGAPQMGTQARLMSQGMRKITKACAASNTTVIFLNQIRHKIQAYGNPETTTGGMALAFFASVRLKLSRGKGGSLTDQTGAESGIRCKVKVVKNKCAPPMKEAEFDILWSCGINKVGCLLDAAEKMGIVTKKGSWYSYKDANLAQGRDKAVALLNEDPDLFSQIEAETRQKYRNPEAADSADGIDTTASFEEDEDVFDDDMDMLVGQK